MVAPRSDKVTVAQLADDLKAEYKANGRRSLDRLELSLAHLLPFFGPQRALQVTSTRVTEYKVKRQEAGAANATINRELSALRRMFSLAVRAERLQHRPHIAMLREDNVRKGFLKRASISGCARSCRRTCSRSRPLPTSPAGASAQRSFP